MYYCLKRFFSGEKNYKYFIGYMDHYKIKPLHIMLLKTSQYVKRFDGKTKWMHFLIEDDELLKKYNVISMEKEFNSKQATYLLKDFCMVCQKNCFGEKNSHNEGKNILEKNSHNSRKVLTTKKEFSQQETKPHN